MPSPSIYPLSFLFIELKHDRDKYVSSKCWFQQSLYLFPDFFSCFLLLLFPTHCKVFHLQIFIIIIINDHMGGGGSSKKCFILLKIDIKISSVYYHQGLVFRVYGLWFVVPLYYHGFCIGWISS